MSVPRILLAALLACAAATAAIVVNLLLLGNASAQNDPVGKLTPRANVPAAPQWTVRPEPAQGEHERDGADD